MKRIFGGVQKTLDLCELGADDCAAPTERSGAVFRLCVVFFVTGNSIKKLIYKAEFTMKRFLCMGVCALTCLVAFNSACVAQANPWDGSWKMDRSSLKYDGPTFSIATDAEGYTVTRGSTASPKTVCDGKAHQTPDGMLTCTKAGTGYEISVAKDGKTIRKATVSLSADGKKRTVKTTRFPAGDKPYTMTTTSERQSGGPGMNGVWKEVSFVESDDTGVMKIKVTGDSISFQETDTPKAMVCKLDGTPTKVEDLGGTISIKKVDDHTLKVTYSSDGQVRRDNTFVLSADGKSISETDVTPAPSPSKMTGTLHKM